MKKVAIIGRPNVGKSTLFNRISRGRRAIVSKVAGTTRDIREYAVAGKGEPEFVIVDTAGFEAGSKNRLSLKMTDKALEAAKEADVILFVIDARTGIIQEDLRLADIIRKYGRRIILVANKAENMAYFNLNLGDMAAFGFGEPLPVSAEHGLGIDSLVDAVRRKFGRPAEEVYGEDDLSEGELTRIIEIEEEALHEPKDLSVRIAIVGRPNAGKSTLVNALLGEDRMLVGPEAGLTRDAIDIEFKYKGRAVKLVDTAGLRKKSKTQGDLDIMCAAHAVEAIRNSDVVVIVIDAAVGLDRQDLIITGLAAGEGKGVVVAINKADVLKDKRAALAAVKNRLEASFHQVKDVPVLLISAANKTGLDQLVGAAFGLYDIARVRVTTGRLNKWLERAVAKNPPPLSRFKRPINLKYITQSAVKPPTFTLFIGGASELPENYARYIVNSLKEEFEFAGVPVRLKTRTSKNPYDEDRK